MTVPTGNRPALCTVPRGARSICLRGNASSAGDGTVTFYVGGSLANTRANDVSVAKYSTKTGSPQLSVESTTTHSFEIWALCSLQDDVLIAGTRTRDLSHIRLLGPSCVSSHVLGGRIISLHLSSAPHVLAVTSSTLEMFELSKGGNDLTPTLREDSYGNVDNTLYESDDVLPGTGPIVAGGFVSGTRAFAVHSSGVLCMIDPREKRTVKFSSSSDSANGLSPTRNLRASTACAFGENCLSISSEHGDLISVDVRRVDTPVCEVRGAHSGWISALGAVSVSAGNGDEVLVSGGADGVVKLWNEKLSCVATLPHHSDSVYGVARGDGFFATVSYEGRLAVNTLQ